MKSKIFDRLRTALSAPASDMAELQAALLQARQQLAVAVEDRARLESERRTMLTADDATRARHKASLAEAGERTADLALFVEELSDRLVAAEAEAEQGQRRRGYDAAKAKAAAAVAVVQREYQQHAAKLLGVLRTIAEAQLAVDQANAVLPVGAEPIADVEMTARGTPAQPRKVLSSSIVDLWAHVGTRQPIPAEQQAWVQFTGKGFGQIIVPLDRRGKATGAGNVQVERRQFRRIEFLPAIDGVVPTQLLGKLRLPDIFELPMVPLYRIGPTEVIDAIDEALANKPQASAPRPQVEFELIPRPTQAKAKAELVDPGRSRLASAPARQARGVRR